MISQNRLTHQLGVARRIVETAKQHGKYSEKELMELFLMGYLHDVGYEFVEDSSEHADAGGNVLKNIGFKYWREIANHGKPSCDYASPELDLLNSADMHTSPIGEPVSYEERLEGIREKYGADSLRYKNAASVIDDLKEAGFA